MTDILRISLTQDKLVPTSEISLAAAPCVLSNDLLLVVEASGGVLQLRNLILDACVCLATGGSLDVSDRYL